MKKLFIALAAIVFVSCSQDQNESVTPVATTSGSVLEGGLLSYKDNASFVKEYGALTEKKSNKELQSWIAKKGHSALLNVVDTTEVIQSKIDNSKIIYSDALKAIVNVDSKVKIDGKVIWINGSNLFLLDEDDLSKNDVELKKQTKSLKVYGNVFSKSSFSKGTKETSRLVVPNENRSIGWGVEYNSASRDRRIDLTLFNETIVLNGETASSKMFLRCMKLGKFCSFWKCRWNEEFEDKTVSIVFNGTLLDNTWNRNPNLFAYGNQTYINANTNTILLATGYDGGSIYFPVNNFKINATVYVTTYNGTARYPYNWSQLISWY
jgi:hypothetical protein